MASEEARQEETRAQLAQEVLELGEELFELALGQQGKAVNEQPSTEAEELCDAKDEFFIALRLLLDEATKGAMS